MLIQPFGPEIYVGSVSDNLCNTLVNLTNKNLNDETKNCNKSLLGFVRKQVSLFEEPEVKSDVLPELQKLILNYLQNSSQFSSKVKVWNNRDITCVNCWSNIQTKNEFIPSHNHPVDIVCVVYPKIEINAQNTYQCNDEAQSGQIVFYYGEGPALFAKTSHSILPKTGTILIFPGWLKHASYPIFSDDDTRISTSFNYMFTDYVRLKLA